ncbi:LOW QUALITY PROTEIN: kinetochore scaffold 1 [Bombina bombina]|uniref:LOW QUALITY PROTEIN: kinetochore scaffold 1 n=1 Tax=Bombina bombina TaxID=8345 RepID=UPI00235A9875|nr:LOW QUALITY PROTEIN: kinetochore scaffold 1 [Bombina bombina]
MDRRSLPQLTNDLPERSRRRLSSILKAPRSPARDLGNEQPPCTTTEKRRKSSRRVSFAETIRVFTELQVSEADDRDGRSARRSSANDKEEADARCKITGMDTLLHAPIQSSLQQSEWEDVDESKSKTMIFSCDNAMDLTTCNTVTIAGFLEEQPKKIDINSFLAGLSSHQDHSSKSTDFTFGTNTQKNTGFQPTTNSFGQAKIKFDDFLANLNNVNEPSEKENFFIDFMSSATSKNRILDNLFHHSQDDSGNMTTFFKEQDDGLDITTCHTTNITEFLPVTDKFPKCESLGSSKGHASNSKESLLFSGGISQTYMFNDHSDMLKEQNVNTQEVDITQSQTINKENSVRPNPLFSNVQMAAKMQKPIESEKTTIFKETELSGDHRIEARNNNIKADDVLVSFRKQKDFSEEEMDLTKSHTVAIDRQHIVEMKYPIDVDYGKTVSSKHDQESAPIISKDNVICAEEDRQTHSNSLQSCFTLDKTVTFSDVKPLQKQQKTECKESASMLNVSSDNEKTILPCQDMDFTQCNTAVLHIVPSPGWLTSKETANCSKLDLEKVLISGENMNKQSMDQKSYIEIPEEKSEMGILKPQNTTSCLSKENRSVIFAEKTVLFPCDQDDMEFTKSHTIAIHDNVLQNSFLPSMSNCLNDKRTNICGLRLSSVSNKSVLFSNDSNEMELSRSHIKCVNSNPLFNDQDYNKLHDLQEKTTIFTSNDDMDITKSLTVSIDHKKVEAAFDKECQNECNVDKIVVRDLANSCMFTRKTIPQHNDLDVPKVSSASITETKGEAHKGALANAAPKDQTVLFSYDHEDMDITRSHTVVISKHEVHQKLQNSNIKSDLQKLSVSSDMTIHLQEDMQMTSLGSDGLILEVTDPVFKKTIQRKPLEETKVFSSDQEDMEMTRSHTVAIDGQTLWQVTLPQKPHLRKSYELSKNVLKLHGDIEMEKEKSDFINDKSKVPSSGGYLLHVLKEKVNLFSCDTEDMDITKSHTVAIDENNLCQVTSNLGKSSNTDKTILQECMELTKIDIDSFEQSSSPNINKREKSAASNEKTVFFSCDEDMEMTRSHTVAIDGNSVWQKNLCVNLDLRKSSSPSEIRVHLEDDMQNTKVGTEKNMLNASSKEIPVLFLCEDDMDVTRSHTFAIDQMGLDQQTLNLNSSLKESCATSVKILQDEREIKVQTDCFKEEVKVPFECDKETMDINQSHLVAIDREIRSQGTLHSSLSSESNFNTTVSFPVCEDMELTKSHTMVISDKILTDIPHNPSMLQFHSVRSMDLVAKGQDAMDSRNACTVSSEKICGESLNSCSSIKNVPDVFHSLNCLQEKDVINDFRSMEHLTTFSNTAYDKTILFPSDQDNMDLTISHTVAIENKLREFNTNQILDCKTNLSALQLSSIPDQSAEIQGEIVLSKSNIIVNDGKKTVKLHNQSTCVNQKSILIEDGHNNITNSNTIDKQLMDTISEEKSGTLKVKNMNSVPLDTVPLVVNHIEDELNKNSEVSCRPVSQTVFSKLGDVMEIAKSCVLDIDGKNTSVLPNSTVTGLEFYSSQKTDALKMISQDDKVCTDRVKEIKSFQEVSSKKQSEKTVIFSYDQDDMDMTKSHTVAIDKNMLGHTRQPSLQTQKLYKNINEHSDKTLEFAADNSMEITRSHTVQINSGKVYPYNVDEISSSGCNRTVFSYDDMEFTRSQTVNIDRNFVVSLKGKERVLDTSDLKGNTVKFSMDDGDLEFTKCHTVAIESEHHHISYADKIKSTSQQAEMEVIKAQAPEVGVVRVTKCPHSQSERKNINSCSKNKSEIVILDGTNTDIIKPDTVTKMVHTNNTIVFTRNPEDMDITKSHTVTIDNKMITQNEVHDIKDNGKSFLGTLSTQDKLSLVSKEPCLPLTEPTIVFSEAHNDMNVTKSIFASYDRPFKGTEDPDTIKANSIKKNIGTIVPLSNNTTIFLSCNKGNIPISGNTLVYSENIDTQNSSLEVYLAPKKTCIEHREQRVDSQCMSNVQNNCVSDLLNEDPLVPINAVDVKETQEAKTTRLKSKRVSFILPECEVDSCKTNADDLEGSSTSVLHLTDMQREQQGFFEKSCSESNDSKYDIKQPSVSIKNESDQICAIQLGNLLDPKLHDLPNKKTQLNMTQGLAPSSEVSSSAESSHKDGYRRKSISDIQLRIKSLTHKSFSECHTAPISYSVKLPTSTQTVNLIEADVEAACMFGNNVLTEENKDVASSDSKGSSATNVESTYKEPCMPNRLSVKVFQPKLPNRRSYNVFISGDSSVPETALNPDRTSLTLLKTLTDGESAPCIDEEMLPVCPDDHEVNNLFNYEVPEGAWEELCKKEAFHHKLGDSESDATETRCSQKRARDTEENGDLHREKRIRWNKRTLVADKALVSGALPPEAYPVNEDSSLHTMKVIEQTSCSNSSSLDSRDYRLTIELSSQQSIQTDSQLPSESGNDQSLWGKFQGDTITVKDIFMLFKINILIQKPRYSVPPAHHRTSNAPTMEDLILDKYIYQPKLQVYEEECHALYQTIEELKLCTTIQEKPLKDVNGLLWEAIRMCSEDEVLYFGVTLRALKSVYSKKIKLLTHKGKVSLYSKLLSNNTVYPKTYLNFCRTLSPPFELSLRQTQCLITRANRERTWPLRPAHVMVPKDKEPWSDIYAALQDFSLQMSTRFADISNHLRSTATQSEHTEQDEMENVTMPTPADRPCKQWKWLPSSMSDVPESPDILIDHPQPSNSPTQRDAAGTLDRNSVHLSVKRELRVNTRQVQLDQLQSKLSHFDKLLEETDNFISLLETETANTCKNVNLAEKDQRVKDLQIEVENINSQEETSIRDCSKLEERRTKIIAHLGSLQEEAQKFDKHLQEYNFTEWELDSWGDDYAIFTFLYDSLELTVTFGELVDGEQFLNKPCRRISNVTFESQLNEEVAPPSSLLVHKLIFQFIEKKGCFKDKHRTQRDLQQLLFDVSLTVSRCKLLGEEIEYLMKWGARYNLLTTHLHCTELKLLFSSSAAFAKFELGIELSESYPALPFSFRVLNRIGSIGHNEISSALSKVPVGLWYLKRAMCHIHKILLE